MIESDRFTDFLIKYEITANQFYILWLLHTKDFKNLKKYVENMVQFDTNDFKVLEDKNLIINTAPPGSRFNTQHLVVTLDFAEEVAEIDPDDAYEELFSIYPAHLVVNGKLIPAKTLTFTDERLAKEAYKKIISKDKFLHMRILGLTTKWKDNNNGYATIKIDKYIAGKYWQEIEDTGNDTIKPSYY